MGPPLARDVPGSTSGASGGWCGTLDASFEAAADGQSPAAGQSVPLTVVPSGNNGAPGFQRGGSQEAAFSVSSRVADSVACVLSSGSLAAPRKSKHERSMLCGEQRNRDNWLGRLEESMRFQNTTLLVIVINALWICVDTQWNHKSLAKPSDGSLPLEPYSTVVEHVFCAYFTMEVLVRFFALRRKCHCFWDGWFLFDTLLVLLMVFETWAMPLVALSASTGNDGANTAAFSSMRLLRLLRLTRMARLMRFFPELMTLVKGMFSATQAVGFILVFLIMVTYVFAILFTVQLGSPDTPEAAEGDDLTAAQMFADLGSSMMTLFTNGMLGDNLYQTLTIIRADSVVLMWIFILYFFISSMTLLNMLIGVLCAVIEDTAKEEAQVRSLWEMKRIIKDAFDSTDSSGDGLISPDEWSTMRNNAQVRRMFEGLGVDPDHLDDRLDQLQETLFGKQRATIVGAPGEGLANAAKGMHFDQFMDKVIELNWNHGASALDLEVLKTQVAASDKELRRRLIRIESIVESLAMEDSIDESKSPATMRPEGLVTTLSRCSTSGALAGSRDSDWLKQVPSELLFHVLKSRSSPS